MQTINIKFQAYIPKSAGNTLLSYFQSDSRFNPHTMLNYNEFRQKLEAADRKGYKWLPEPGNTVSNYFFGTDDVNFHNKHSDHDVRLSLTMNLDIAKIGIYSLFDQKDIFRHSCGNSNQHSDESSRIEAFIRAVPEYYGQSKTGVFPTDKKYEGICIEKKSETSDENPLKTRIKNTLTGSYFNKQGTIVKNDTTIISASASASYPFLKYIAPSIDFNIEVELYLNGNSILITVRGQHNDFPAYELIIDNDVIYNYDPAKNGHTSGPSLYNLGMASTKFRASKRKSLDNFQLKRIQNSRNEKRFG